jgi:hypothetical protein
MNIGQPTHEMAPPAGVEPTTYRLGGRNPNTPERIDSIQNQLTDRPIFPSNLRKNSRKKIDARQRLLDKLPQPALLTTRIQPLRRPILRLPR